MITLTPMQEIQLRTIHGYGRTFVKRYSLSHLQQDKILRLMEEMVFTHGMETIHAAHIIDDTLKVVV